MIKCCHYCKERHDRCWSTCEKYIAERAEYQAIKTKARKEKQMDQTIREILKREF